MDKERDQFIGLMKEFYYFLSDKLPARQDNLFRTYLWVASLCVTLNLLLWQHKFHTHTASGPCLLSATSLALAFICFLSCLQAMIGKQDLDHPDMLVYLKEIQDYDEHKVALKLGEHFWEIILREKELKSSRGRRLRSTAQGLILSFVLLGASAAASVFQ